MSKSILRILGLSISVVLGFSSCSTETESISTTTEEEGISISESITRAIKFNSDNRSKSTANTMVKKSKELNKSMLPSLTASSGYPMRSSKRNIPSIGEEDIDLSISYNLLDYAINYTFFSNEEDIDKISDRLKHRTLQNLIHETKTAFWRAAVSQKNKEAVDHLIELLRFELLEAAKAEDKINLSIESLKYQKEIHALMEELMAFKQEMAASELDFSLLTHIPVDEVRLKLPEDMNKFPAFFIPELSLVENQALINRPETLIGDYNVKMNSSEVRKASSKLFPKINLGNNLRYNPEGKYPSDYEEEVTEVSFNIISIPTQRLSSDTDLGMERKKRTAINMGILSEVNVAYRRIKEASEAMDIASSLQSKYKQEWEKAVEKEKKGAISRSELVMSIANKVIGDLKRDFAFAELKAAESGLNLASGLDFIKNIDTTDTMINIHKEVLNGLLNERGVNPSNIKQVTKKEYVKPSVKIEANSSMPMGREEDKWAKGDWLDSIVKEEEKLLKEKKVEADKDKQEVAGKALEKELSSDNKTSSKVSNISEQGRDLLQIGSFKDIDSAKNYWSNIQIKYPFLTKYQVEYREANIEGKPVNRVFIKGEKEELKQLCKKLPEAKDCIIRQ